MEVAWKPGVECVDVDPLSRDPRHRTTRAFRIVLEEFHEDQHTILLDDEGEEIGLNKEFCEKYGRAPEEKEAKATQLPSIREEQLEPPDEVTMTFSHAQGCGVTHCRLSSVEREEERQEEEKDEDLIWAQLMKSILLDEQREDANLAPHIEELGRKGSVRESSGVYELQNNTGVLRKKSAISTGYVCPSKLKI